MEVVSVLHSLVDLYIPFSPVRVPTVPLGPIVFSHHFPHFSLQRVPTLFQLLHHFCLLHFSLLFFLCFMFLQQMFQAHQLLLLFIILPWTHISHYLSFQIYLFLQRVTIQQLFNFIFQRHYFLLFLHLSESQSFLYFISSIMIYFILILIFIFILFVYFSLTSCFDFFK